MPIRLIAVSANCAGLRSAPKGCRVAPRQNQHCRLHNLCRCRHNLPILFRPGKISCLPFICRLPPRLGPSYRRRSPCNPKGRRSHSRPARCNRLSPRRDLRCHRRSPCNPKGRHSHSNPTSHPQDNNPINRRHRYDNLRRHNASSDRQPDLLPVYRRRRLWEAEPVRGIR